MEKLYCYVDETGQDTRGRFFLVSIVIAKKQLKEALETELLELEKRTGKEISKWHAASFKKRIAYLRGVVTLRGLRDCLFYASYHTTLEYLPLTTYTIAQALNHKTRNKEYIATIIIDGLNERERDRVAYGLRQLTVRYEKIRGVRDESDPFIRLADALAGFLRDVEEGQAYAKEFMAQFGLEKILIKIE